MTHGRSSRPVLLAEGPSIDGGLLVVLLAIAIAVVVLTVAAAVLGCVWARRAGRGSRPALVGFLAVAAVEALVLLGAAVDQALVTAAVAGSLLLAQGALFERGRRERQPAPPWSGTDL